MDEMTLREFEKFKLFMRIQADYGKWLAATIAVLQSGALFALGEGKFPHAPRCAYLPFLIGLIAIMFSGLCSWLNFTLLGMAAERRFEYQLEMTEWWRWWINASLIAALLLGLVSGFAFIWGVVRLG